MPMTIERFPHQDRSATCGTINMIRSQLLNGYLVCWLYQAEVRLAISFFIDTMRGNATGPGLWRAFYI